MRLVMLLVAVLLPVTAAAAEIGRTDGPQCLVVTTWEGRDLETAQGRVLILPGTEGELVSFRTVGGERATVRWKVGIRPVRGSLGWGGVPFRVFAGLDSTVPFDTLTYSRAVNDCREFRP